MGRQVSRLSWASFQELLGQMGFQGQKLNPELCGWLTSLMCLDLSSSDLTMCRSRPTEALGSPVLGGHGYTNPAVAQPVQSSQMSHRLCGTQRLQMEILVHAKKCGLVLYSLPSGDTETESNWHVLKPLHPFVWFGLANCICLAKEKCINCSASVTNGN